MRRPVLLVSAAVFLVAAGLASWLWWTAAPGTAERARAGAAAEAPADADGALVLGDPARTARWLARRPQALALLAMAAGGAEPELRRLAPAAAALGSEAALGTVAIWWRGDRVQASAVVRRGALAPLRLVCARQGLSVAASDLDSGLVGVAVAADDGVASPKGKPAPPPAGIGTAAALFHDRDRWWWVHAARASLRLSTGVPPQLPAVGDSSLIASRDVAGLFAPLLPADSLPHGPALVRLAGREWAISLPDARLPKQVEGLLHSMGDESLPTPPGARRWSGILGELWVLRGAGITIASRQEGLQLAGAPFPSGDMGVLRGGDLAALLQRLADALAHLPFQDERVARLRRTAVLASGVRAVRWNLEDRGGRIEMEW